MEATKRRHHLTRNLLRFLPEDLQYLFAAECVKNVAIKNKFSQKVVDEAYGVATLVQMAVWGIGNPYSYNVNMPEEYRYEMEHFTSETLSSFSSEERKLFHVYWLLNDCVKMAGEIMNGRVGRPLDMASDIAYASRNFGGKKSTTQTNWQRQNLVKYHKSIVQGQMVPHCRRKLFATYAEIAVWEWLSSGRSVDQIVIDAVMAMKNKPVNYNAIDKIKNATLGFIESPNDPRLNSPNTDLAILITMLLRACDPRINSGIRSKNCFSFRYLERWIGTDRADSLEEKMISTVGQTTKESVQYIKDINGITL